MVISSLRRKIEKKNSLTPCHFSHREIQISFIKRSYVLPIKKNKSMFQNLTRDDGTHVVTFSSKAILKRNSTYLRL